MNFYERINLTRKVLEDCPYEIQKAKIVELFNITNSSIKEDILLRLFVIDSCYSTNMSRRLFGFEELSELIIDIEPLSSQINVNEFININLTKLLHSIGIDKKGNAKGHAFSLISKYIYFRTKFNFPIYDRLVFDGLVEERLLKRPQKPSRLYFERLTEIKNKYNISFDDLDKYFWVCGKIREGNLSLLISNIQTYKNDFLEKFELTNEELQSKSNEFNKILANKLVSGNIVLNNSKLEKIQLLAKSIKNETVFDKMKAQKICR